MVALLIILVSLMSVTAYRGHYLDDDPREAADMSVSWCRLYETEAWSENLASALDGTRVRVILVNCVSEPPFPFVNVTDLNGGKHQRVRESNETVQQFVNAVLRLLCDPLMTVVDEESDMHLLSMSRSIFIIALLREPTELQMFQTSLLSVASLPKNILPVIAVSKSSLIPFSVGRGLKVWRAGGGEWWPTDVNSINEQAEIKSGLMEYLNAVAFPNILEYSGVDSGQLNDQLRNFHRFYLLHHTDQLQVLFPEFILPLARRFLGDFVFVTVDCDLFSAFLKRYDLSRRTELPYFIMLKKNDSEGIHVQQKNIPYTTESLGSLLESVVNPEDIKVAPSSASNDILVSFADLNTVHSVVNASHIPVLAVICKNDDSECYHLYHSLEGAALVMNKKDKKQSMRLFVIQVTDISEVEDLKVDILPSAVVYADREWKTPFSDFLGKDRFLTAIEHYCISAEEAAKHQEQTGVPSTGQYPPSHEELVEDDPYALLYRSSPALPKSIPHLNTTTYLAFNKPPSASMIAFYLPYCVQCRPLLQHFITAEIQLVEGGVKLAVVNCADFPDVCMAYNVSTYPTVLYRLSGSDWSTYHGVLNAASLLQRMGTETSQVPNDLFLEELTPSSLPRIMASPVLPTLVILCVKEPSPVQKEAMEKWKHSNDYREFQFYWMNSSLHDQVIHHLLQGKVCPAIIVVNYSKRSVFNKELREPFNVEDVGDFLVEVASGKQEPNYIMQSVPWPPKGKAIKFPSEEYLRRESERKRFNGPHQKVPVEYYPLSPTNSPSPRNSPSPHMSLPPNHSSPHLSSHVVVQSPHIVHTSLAQTHVASHQLSSSPTLSSSQNPHEEL